jgi:hypothetical protein
LPFFFFFFPPFPVSVEFVVGSASDSSDHYSKFGEDSIRDVFFFFDAGPSERSDVEEALFCRALTVEFGSRII